ncbi:zf-HC2 domain-containing protein [Paenibacillus piscarius]|uniref:zf-HC2 domain-containing protein n=1 Tax=Paenibacillus piscarius TaxID=1089681 RepID=UPI001EE7FA4E|nr:zf-HC2 domain-containing protein [Paenibacillus piscarius]
MNCAEVMEWMHRYLDHDLSQEEILEMFRHIDDCPACAEVFDRLTMLSQQLEQLPDVKPPFSLVDSILPRLEQLDQGVPEVPVVPLKEDPKVVPFTRSNTRSKKPRGSSLATRTGIGAAAAAVILLFALFNKPESMPNADMDMAVQTSASGAATEMANSNSGNSNSAAPGAGQTDGGDVSFMKQAPAEDGAGEELQATPPVSVKSADQPPTADQAPATDAGTVPGKAPVVTPAPRPDKRSATPQPESGKSGGKGDRKVLNDKSAAPSAPVQEFSAADQPPDERIAGDQPAGDRKASGLMAAGAGNAWASPDGHYSAEQSGQQLIIYSSPAAGAEERTILTSLLVEGNVISVTWSEDGRKFTYVTALPDGTEATQDYMLPAEPATPAPSEVSEPSTSPAEPSVSPGSSPAVTPDAATSNKSP